MPLQLAVVVQQEQDVQVLKLVMMEQIQYLAQ
jgi:hypothetical protein